MGPCSFYPQAAILMAFAELTDKGEVIPDSATLQLPFIQPWVAKFYQAVVKIETSYDIVRDLSEM